MAGVSEAARAKTILGSDLGAGVETISLDQKIKFTLYARVVLPLDGYVFFIRSDLLSAPVLVAAKPVSTATLARIEGMRAEIHATGSLHYATDVRQEEAETLAVNAVTFTSLREIQDLNYVSPALLYIGEFDGRRFAFSRRKSFFKQANLWHYVGDAIYPDMEAQIIDSVADFDATDVVVSNSLPAWLALNNYAPVYGYGNAIPLFPSFLVPPNIEPPWGAVHVYPESTRELAMTQTIDPATSTLDQLCAERVKVTLWGTRNNDALDFVACVNQYSADQEIIGLMNVPVIQDEKRTQAELAAIAMKKSVTFEVSYQQRRINDVARQIIKRALVSFYIEPPQSDAQPMGMP